MRAAVLERPLVDLPIPEPEPHQVRVRLEGCGVCASNLPPTVGAGEPLACGFNVFERARVEPGQTVAVIGIGFLGAIVVHLAARAGAEVIAISRRDSSLSTGSLDLEALITHEFTLDRIGDAVETACERPEGFIKAVLHYD